MESSKDREPINFTERTVAAFAIPTDRTQAVYWTDDPVGFGVVVGRTGTRTFIVRGRVRGTRIKVKIGGYRAPRKDGTLWTVAYARERAVELLGLMAGGTNPNAPTREQARAAGPTLRDALAAHVRRMTAKHRAERSISTLRNEVEKYLSDRLDRPISELTGRVLVDLYASIKAGARTKAGANPRNAKGAPLANRVIAEVGACWNSLNRELDGTLGAWNPAKSVSRDVLKPKRQRLDETQLPDWAARVATMRNPIQRDGLTLALYTGLRSEDVRTIRWEHVDFDEQTLRLPDPKGGEGAAFTIPLSTTPFGILKRRQRENASIAFIASAGGDHGWAFPSVGNEGDVVAIGDLRQQVHGEKHGRFPVEDVHTLRRTWESIAHEEGITELDQHVLSNHSFGAHNVNATYIAQHIDHLATCADKIDAGIRRRLKPTPSTSSTASKRKRERGELRSVP